MEHQDIVNIQQQIVDHLHQFGARVTYEKDFDWIACIRNYLQGYTPIINIEALLLGQRFGIVIGYPEGYEQIIHTDKFKIFHVTNYHHFVEDFNTFVNEQLAK